MKGFIEKPMLAGTLESMDDLIFPVAISEKIDGIRAMKRNGKLLSRTLKPIPNPDIRAFLEEHLPDGADGEIVSGDSFQDTTSYVMTSKPVAKKPFQFFWFDYVKDSADKPYLERMEDMKDWLDKAKPNDSIKPLFPMIVSDVKSFKEFEAKILKKGGEGVMIRSLESPYKFGRSTSREGFLVKWKRFKDAEAKVIGYEPLIRDGKAVAELGSLTVITDGIEFGIGSGYTVAQRREFWQNRSALIGKLVKYKFFDIGVKTAPRFPVFIGFRSKLDL
jgi:DNA ligase-1